MPSVKDNIENSMNRVCNAEVEAELNEIKHEANRII